MLCTETLRHCDVGALLVVDVDTDSTTAGLACLICYLSHRSTMKPGISRSSSFSICQVSNKQIMLASLYSWRNLAHASSSSVLFCTDRTFPKRMEGRGSLYLRCHILVCTPAVCPLFQGKDHETLCQLNNINQADLHVHSDVHSDN